MKEGHCGDREQNDVLLTDRNWKVRKYSDYYEVQWVPASYTKGEKDESILM